MMIATVKGDEELERNELEIEWCGGRVGSWRAAGAGVRDVGGDKKEICITFDELPVAQG